VARVIAVDAPFYLAEQPEPLASEPSEFDRGLRLIALPNGREIGFNEKLTKPTPATTNVTNLADLGGARIYCASRSCGQWAVRVRRVPPLVAVALEVDGRTRVASHPLALDGSRRHPTTRKRRDEMQGFRWQDVPAEIQCHRCGARGFAIALPMT
jgi:hypothetical protein